MFYSFLLGDNLFTAIAVSRMCNMVASDHRVIVLKASYGDQSDAAPAISYHLLEEQGNNQSMLCASTTGDGECDSVERCVCVRQCGGEVSR